MLRPRKQIHGLYLFCMIPLLFQPFSVAGGGGGVTADVDDPAGGHLDDGGEGGLVAALAGRVKDDDIRVQALDGQLGRGLAGVSAEEAALGGDGIAHPGGVRLRAVDGLGYDLHADQLPAGVHHRQADGTHAAVEVQQQVVRRKLGVVGGDAVKLFGGEGVDLIEGKRPEPDRNALQGIFNNPGAVQGKRLMAEDDVGVFGVDVQQDGSNIVELLTQLAHQLVGVGKFRPGADQTDHDLPAVRTPPQEDVADKPFAALFVVGLDVVHVEEGAECIADLIQKAGLQLAVGAGDDPMGTAGVEANAGLAVFIAAHRELDFVAVAVHFRRGESRQNGNIQPADPPEGIGHAVLFGGKFGLVPEVAEAASAAGPGGRAVRGDAVGRGGQQLVQNAEGIPAAVLDDLDPGRVAGGCARDKDGLAVLRVGDAAAVVGQPLDLQGQKLIFL